MVVAMPVSDAKERTMKLATIALAIAFAVPSTFALAQGGNSWQMLVTNAICQPIDLA
jgi:hypothetical protein